MGLFTLYATGLKGAQGFSAAALVAGDRREQGSSATTLLYPHPAHAGCPPKQPTLPAHPQTTPVGHTQFVEVAPDGGAGVVLLKEQLWDGVQHAPAT